MSGSVVYSLNQVLGRVFPERRVYVRSDARTRYWTFSPFSQAGISLVIVGLLGWSGLTSYAYIAKAMDGRTAENRLAATQETYEIQLGALRDQQRLVEEELNRSNARGDAVTRELSEKQRILVETATRLQTSEVELEGLRSQFEALVAERRRETEQVNLLNEEIVALRLNLAEAARENDTRAATLSTFSQTISDVIEARDTASARADTLDERVASLETEVAAWENRQQNLLAQLEDATR
ncbi:MAG: DUF5930 domain-containing protein, partial [Pseudomonadota bacterium]